MVGFLYRFESFKSKVVKKKCPGAPGWLSRVSGDFNSSHDLTARRLMSSIPATDSVLTARSLLPIRVSLSLCPSPGYALSLSLSLSKINKHLKNDQKILPFIPVLDPFQRAICMPMCGMHRFTPLHKDEVEPYEDSQQEIKDSCRTGPREC